MANISKVQVNGVEYDIKDPKALSPLLVGSCNCYSGAFDVTGLIEEGHIYLLAFKYIGDVFYFILPTYLAFEGKHRGCFGGYNEIYNTGQPVHPYFVNGWVEDIETMESRQVCQITLRNESNEDVTQDASGYGDYEMYVYKLV